MSGRLVIVLASLSAALAVALGAYGAHGLAAEAALIDQFDTANRYHMWHSLALFGVGLFLKQREYRGTRDRLAQLAAIVLVLGIVLFCGTLYAGTLLSVQGLGALAPVGGLSFIAGWLLLAAAACRSV